MEQYTYSDGPLIIRCGQIETQIYSAQYSNPSTGAAIERLFREMGSPRAFLCEFLLAQEWGADYYRRNQSKGADLISRDGTKRSLEVKATNRTGAVDLQPSGGKGMNRVPKISLFFENCQTTDYVVVDSQYLADTGDIRYVVLSGGELLRLQTYRFKKTETFDWFQTIR